MLPLLVFLSACAGATGPASLEPAAIDEVAAESLAADDIVYAQGTLGGALHQQLRTISGRCLPNQKDVRKFLGQGETRMIEEFAGLQMNSVILPVEGAQLNPIFRFVYTREGLDEFVKDGPGQPWRWLEVDGASVEPRADLNNLLYVHSCTSMMRAALDAGVNASWPAATLKAALDAEFDQNKNVHFTLVSGRFTSPVTAALRQPASAARLDALLRIWQFYVNNPTYAAQDVWLLDNLNGWYLANLTGVARRTRGKISSEAGGNWMVASVNNTMASELRTNADLQASAYRVFVMPEGAAAARYGNFQRLPSLSEINLGLNHAVRHLPAEDATKQHAGDGGVQQHRQAVLGMPGFLCSPLAWQPGPLTAPGIPGTVTLLNVQPNAEEPGRCTFLISFTPQWAAIPQAAKNAGELEIAYEIRSTATVNTAADTQPLIITARAPIPLSSQPILQSIGAGRPTASISRDGGTYRVQTEVQFQVHDDQVRINRSQFGAQGRATPFPISLSCGTWSRSGTSWVVPEGSQYSLHAELTFPASTNAADLPGSPECELRASVALPRQGATGHYDRVLSSTVQLASVPAPDPVPAPAAPAAPGEMR